METLDGRLLLSADGILSAVSPNWFADFSDATEPRHVNPAGLTLDELSEGIYKTSTSATSSSDVYDWIIHFDPTSLEGISTADRTASLLTAPDDARFEVLRGLGLTGQVLVRSWDASADSIANWLSDNSSIFSFELDVVRDLQVMPDDDRAWVLWGMNNTGQTGGTTDADIDAAEAWDISTGSSSTVVAVIDTGVDYNHVDLAANIWTNPGEIAGNGIDDDGNGFIDDVHGYDFVNDDGDPMDDNNHGTHCAGTIAGAGNNGIGVAGVNWSASIMALKFLDANGSGYTSDAIRAVNYATMMRTDFDVNVRVTSNSWGGGGYSSAMNSAIQASGDVGILFVAAAGNDSTNNDISPHYPSNYNQANVLSVAATDHNDALSSFSNYGATTVHLAAPGSSIYSTVAGGGYATYSGTSMATPHVAGVALLAWSVDPDATVAEVRDAILQGTDPLVSLAGKTITGGRLNAYNTLQLFDSGESSVPSLTSLTVSPNPIYAGTTVTLTAAGVSDADGTVSGVYFYQDTNLDGQWDEGDQLLAADTTIVDSQASITFDTTSLSPGNYRFFARALDNEPQWSIIRSAVLIVNAPDDHGDSAATATSISPGQTLDGAIDPSTDQDWFAFNATAGAVYRFTTELVTMSDSVLTLYDQDGVTVLDADDDGGTGYASQLSFSAPTTGTYYVSVTAYPNTGIGTYRLACVVMADDHSNAAATASSIAEDQSTSGSIEYDSDIDYFAFQASENREYVASTSLSTLEDSVLYVYDQDGTTLLTWDDDSGGGTASQAIWTGIAGRTYYVAVEAFSYDELGDYTLYVTAGIAEIEVMNGSEVVVDGDSSPSASDGTDLGSFVRYDVWPTSTWRVYNTGTATLTTGNLQVPSRFIISEALDASIAPGAYDDFSIRMDTTVAGTHSGQISFATSDSDEDSFNFEITGVVIDPFAPEIEVTNGSVVLVDGDNSPSTSDATDLGSFVRYDVWPTQTWRVHNTGGSTLTTGILQVPSRFIISEALDASIAPGDYDDFSIRMDTTVAGTNSGQISFITNDTDESSFNFEITGVVIDPFFPEIEVKNDNVVVGDGDSSPSASDGTDLGSFAQYDVWPTQTWRVYNTGESTLTTGNLQVPSRFIISEALDASIAPGAYDDFSVRMDTTIAGTNSGQITFITNDDDESSFNFEITGVVIAPLAAEIEVRNGSVLLVDGDNSPSTNDGTDLGSFAQYDVWPTQTWRVYNTGGSALTTGNLQVPNRFIISETLDASIAPGDYDDFSVRMDTTVAGTNSGQITFVTSDGDENPFNFQIMGVVTAPLAAEIEVRSGSVLLVDGDNSPDASDGTDLGSFVRHDVWPTQTWRVYNTGGATLTTGNLQVPSRFIISEALDASIAPGDYDDFSVRMDTTVAGTNSGQITFVTNDGDENPFNFQITGVVTESLAAEIEVRSGSVVVVDGDNSPDASDGTDLGSFVRHDVWPTQTWRVYNTGTATLTTGNLQVPSRFIISETLDASIAPGAYDDFSVRMDTTVTGTNSGQISFITNDGDENPFNFEITGIVTDPLGPTIEVRNGSVIVLDGDSSPSASDGTDFGSFVEHDVWPTQTWRVYNTGASTLTTANLQVPSYFIISETLDASIASGAYDDFSVRMNTTVAGTNSGQISFVTNDSSKNSFNFEITGTVAAHQSLAYLQATSGVLATSGPGQTLTNENLAPILNEAISRWAETGLSGSVLARLQQIELQIVDLADSQLGMALTDQVFIDSDGAGNGWFLDTTPGLDEEFDRANNVCGMLASAQTASNRMDLLTVLIHELGHIAGLDDLHDTTSVMEGDLSSGVRLAPTAADIDAVFAE